MNPTFPEHEIKGGRWVSPETFAQEYDGLSLKLIRSMLRKDPRSAFVFDPRDVRRFGRSEYRIYMTRRDIHGNCCPRIIERPNARRKDGPDLRRRPRSGGRKALNGGVVFVAQSDIATVISHQEYDAAHKGVSP